MITVCTNKRNGYAMFIIPIQNEENIKLFTHHQGAIWAYSKDGKAHSGIPAVVLPTLEDIWGGEELIKKAGYTKHWMVFKDLSNGKYYFCNHASFANSDMLEDRQKASEMIELDIEELKKM